MSGKKKILFVCTGNTCRSPMAAGIMRSKVSENEIEVLSAGIAASNGSPPASTAVQILQDEGIDISNHRTTMLTGDLLDEAELVLVMSQAHKDSIVSWFRSMEPKVHLLREYDPQRNDHFYPDIPDPIGAGPDMYTEVKEMIERSIEGLLKEL